MLDPILRCACELMWYRHVARRADKRCQPTMTLQVTLAVDCRLCVSADAKTTVQYSLLVSIVRMQSYLIEHRNIARQDTLQRSQY